ncbi:unnamed protein product [Adineta ricciae]|uniref:Uncharacterized protein n=1 Tax=Adineta ricciae TaxID=249248 RepID=A0A816CN98_ADIRI|nr:unnamed protein product [Adineta ricciae]
MATDETLGKSAMKTLPCNGRSCPTCNKCCDWRFTGDADTWNWIRNYSNWANDDWQRWRRNRMWKLYKLKDGAACNSTSRGPGNTYDDPVFGGHHTVHNVSFAPGLSIKASHDFIFVGDQISSENQITSSIGDMCVCENK